jgi:hypothetical protein
MMLREREKSDEIRHLKKGWKGAGDVMAVETQQRAVEAARALIERDGLSSNAAAREVAATLGVAPRTVQNWAASQGKPLGDLSHADAKKKTTAANLATVSYGADQRRALLDQSFAKLEAMLPTIETPHDMRELVMALAVMIDKARLEEGRATERTEQVPVSGDPERTLELGESRLAFMRSKLSGSKLGNRD